VYTFAGLEILAPWLGVVGATFVLRSRQRQSSNDKIAIVLLALNSFFVGITLIGLPVSAAAGFGSTMWVFLLGSTCCAGCAAASLALAVLLSTSTSAHGNDETERLAVVTSEALVASERRVDEMSQQMKIMLEQQAKLLAALSIDTESSASAESGDAQAPGHV